MKRQSTINKKTIYTDGTIGETKTVEMFVPENEAEALLKLLQCFGKHMRCEPSASFYIDGTYVLAHIEKTTLNASEVCATVFSLT